MNDALYNFINELRRNGFSLDGAIRIAKDFVEPVDMKFMETRAIKVGAFDVLVFRGGPDDRPWYNFELAGKS